jgi:hypothetical protein
MVSFRGELFEARAPDLSMRMKNGSGRIGVRRGAAGAYAVRTSGCLAHLSGLRVGFLSGSGAEVQVVSAAGEVALELAEGLVLLVAHAG